LQGKKFPKHENERKHLNIMEKETCIIVQFTFVSEAICDVEFQNLVFEQQMK